MEDYSNKNTKPKIINSSNSAKVHSRGGKVCCNKLQKRYSNITKIGEGGAAEIYFAVNKIQQKECALKITRLDSTKRRKHFKTETKLQKALNHPNICQLQKVKIIRIAGESYGLSQLEKADIDLLQLIQLKNRLTEKETKLLFREICFAVLYCHQNHVAHLDIKPDNILLQYYYNEEEEEEEETQLYSSLLSPELFFQRMSHQVGKRRISGEDDSSYLSHVENIKNIKLCDFGFARKWNKKKQSLSIIKLPSPLESIGTLEYRAPELIIPANSHISLEKADVYSLGVTLFSMLTGSFPVTFINGKVSSSLNLDVICQFTKGSYIAEEEEENSSAFSLITKMLSSDPFERPSLTQILADPWLTSL